MNSKHVILIAGLAAGASLSAYAASAWLGVGHRCDLVAEAILEAAESQAEVDYWITAANCLNDPNANLAQCRQDALAERDEAEDEAEEQRDARLEVCALLGHGVYAPTIVPADFSANVTNTLFPFPVGRKLIYEKMVGTDVERIEIESLAQTVDINGVTCRVVRDVETLNGVVKEDTQDWFAQHVSGEVWYFGEIVLNFEEGFLEDLGGSWRYGKDSAQPGILMLAAPAVGDAYRQEFLANVAEDLALVLETDVTVTVPAGTFLHCIKTREGSPLEPGNFEFKYYAPGVGMVAEEDPVSGERLELIQIL